MELSTIKKMAICLMLFTSSASANNAIMADGFFPVSKINYKVSGSGVFVFCDKPDALKKKCQDVLIRSNGSAPGEYLDSEWRNADKYVKHTLDDTFAFAGMQPSDFGLYLFYKKIKDN